MRLNMRGVFDYDDYETRIVETLYFIDEFSRDDVISILWYLETIVCDRLLKIIIFQDNKKQKNKWRKELNRIFTGIAEIEYKKYARKLSTKEIIHYSCEEVLKQKTYIERIETIKEFLVKYYGQGEFDKVLCGHKKFLKYYKKLFKTAYEKRYNIKFLVKTLEKMEMEIYNG